MEFLSNSQPCIVARWAIETRSSRYVDRCTSSALAGCALHFFSKENVLFLFFLNIIFLFFWFTLPFRVSPLLRRFPVASFPGPRLARGVQRAERALWRPGSNEREFLCSNFFDATAGNRDRDGGACNFVRFERFRKKKAEKKHLTRLGTQPRWRARVCRRIDGTDNGIVIRTYAYFL